MPTINADIFYEKIRDICSRDVYYLDQIPYDFFQMVLLEYVQYLINRIAKKHFISEQTIKSEVIVEKLKNNKPINRFIFKGTMLNIPYGQGLHRSYDPIFVIHWLLYKIVNYSDYCSLQELCSSILLFRHTRFPRKKYREMLEMFYSLFRQYYSPTELLLLDYSIPSVYESQNDIK